MNQDQPGRIVGDAPRLTPSIKTALTDLELDHLAIVYPGNSRYALSDQMSAFPLVLPAEADRLPRILQSEAATRFLSRARMNHSMDVRRPPAKVGHPRINLNTHLDAKRTVGVTAKLMPLFAAPAHSFYCPRLSEDIF